MIYVVHRLDKPGTAAQRTQMRQAHLAYLQEHAHRILVAGPYVDPADGKDCGSLFLVQCADLAEARAFADNDPFAAAGMFSEVQVRPWFKRLGSLPMPEA